VKERAKKIAKGGTVQIGIAAKIEGLGTVTGTKEVTLP
jgi:hypothetical protein